MAGNIILYDIRSRFDDGAKEPALWSPNTWRARLALNVKGIPFTTEYVDLVDIQSAMKSLGAPSTGKIFDNDVFTVPTILDRANGNIIADSQTIVAYLESEYPDTAALFPPHTKALQKSFVDATFLKLVLILFPLLCRQLYEHCTPESSREYFKSSRSAYFNKDWENLQAKGDKRLELINEFLAVLKEIYDCVQENDATGVFLTSPAISNADINTAAALLWAKRVGGADSDIWQAIVTANDGFWLRFMEAIEPYTFTPSP